MRSTAQSANRLVPRSAADTPSTMVPTTSAPSSSSASSVMSSQPASSRSQSRQNQPTEKSSSAFRHSPSRVSTSLFFALRRYWKKLNETDSSGKRSRIAQAFAAFKMGLYFKVIITLILLVRFASHSSQRAYPFDAVLREDHFRALATAPVSSNLRIIIITRPGYTDKLHHLLKSFSEANYNRDVAALDVWMFASSVCNYVPLPLYPLAMAVFGPPRFDHSIPPIVQSFNWVHGPKQLIAARTEPDWVQAWESNQGTVNETLVFVDATVTRSISPTFYTWLKRVRETINRGRITNAPVLSLDAVTVPVGVPPSDTAVLLDQFFPASAVFSPTQDVWITFQKWYTLRTRSWFARPRLPHDLALGSYSILEYLRVHPARAWFSQFLATYGERVVHPVLPQGQTLLVRAEASTAGAIAGSGLVSNVHLERRGELDSNCYRGNLLDSAIPERPIVIKSNGSVVEADAVFGYIEGKRAARERRTFVADVLDMDAARKYHDAVRQIGEFARSRGSDVVSMTIVTSAFVNMMKSWFCNVAVLEIAPPAMVLVASEDEVANNLRSFLSQHPRLGQASYVVSMRGAINAIHEPANAPLHFGTSAYWRLMLLRTMFLRDLLDLGLAVFHFEADQVWLSDPLPYIRHEIRTGPAKEGIVEDYRAPDAVVTINTLGELAGGFFYFRSTVGSRHLMSSIVDRFLLSYSASRSSRAARHNRFHYIANDQSIMTTLITGRDWVYARQFPKIKVAVLSRDLFVDGQWFADFEDEFGKRVSKRKHYTSESSLYPVVVNNNFVVGVVQKMKRVQRFGFWFISEETLSESSHCDVAAVQRAARSGSIKEQRDAPVVELGRQMTRL